MAHAPRQWYIEVKTRMMAAGWVITPLHGPLLLPPQGREAARGGRGAARRRHADRLGAKRARPGHPPGVGGAL
eukprot:2073369-Alexandrium_andersonii.AAC.1